MEKMRLLDELRQLTSLSAAQRAELGKRLTHHRTHPGEAGVTLDKIRRKLVAG